MHHVLLGRRLDILKSHRLDRLLFCAQLVFEDLKLDSILGDLLFLVVKSPSKFLHLVLDPLLVGLEEADFLRVELVILPLFFDFLSTAVKRFFLHAETLDLLLKLVVQLHDLGLFLLKLGLLLIESSLFSHQVTATVLRKLKLFAKFDFSLVHFLAEVLPCDFDLF